MSQSIEGVVQSNEVSTALQAWIAESRAFLLVRNREQLDRLEAASRVFTAAVARLAPSAREPVDSQRIAKVQDSAKKYDAALRQATNNPDRATWILERVVRPERLELERNVSALDRSMRDSLAESTEASRKASISARREVTTTAIATLVLILGITWLLRRILNEEQQARDRATQSKDALQVAQRQATLLAETGRILSETPDFETSLRKVSELSVDWLSNLCIIELSKAQGLPEPVAFATADPKRDALLRGLHEKLPDGLASLFSVRERVLRIGQAELEVEIADDRLRALGILSCICVPLRVRERTLGVLLLVRNQGHPVYRAEDLRFAQEFSHQTALAIDNARLFMAAEMGLKMKEELLATVAHDLKNPLTAIGLNSDIIQRKSELMNDESVRRPIESIRTSAEEMQRLIHDLLELTQLESGRITLEPKPHDAAELINTSLTLVAPQAAFKSIDVIRDVKSGECIALCDRNRTLQVLSNLIGNAIKFTPKGGKIRVEAQVTGDGIRFGVIDNGPGIAPEQLDQVFGRYWQANPAKGRGSGSGLGLSIARGIVERHGGRIWAESAIGMGARFFFTLAEARQKQRKNDSAAA
jgi:signal transduction histidine kinase/CHASE3 domain sensor protein